MSESGIGPLFDAGYKSGYDAAIEAAIGVVHKLMPKYDIETELHMGAHTAYLYVIEELGKLKD